MLSDDLIRKTKKAVKNAKDKQRILVNKGVSPQMLTKIGTAGEILKAFENDKKGLRKRITQLNRISTKGVVKKTKGGLYTTSTVSRLKNKEIKDSQELEQQLYDKAKRGGLTSTGYHKRRKERLKDIDIESANFETMRSVNYAITNPEFQKLESRQAVGNFLKAINFNWGGMDNDTFYQEEGKRIRKYVSQLTPDELDDMLTNNSIVKSIMNYYRERDKIENGQEITFSGGSYEERIKELSKSIPYIVGSYKRKR